MLMYIVVLNTFVVLLVAFIVYALVENESDTERALMEEMQNTVHPFDDMNDLSDIQPLKWR